MGGIQQELLELEKTEVMESIVGRKSDFTEKAIGLSSAKRVKSLQRTMEVHWVIHDFIRVHFTTQEVPAVKLGILETGLACLQVFMIR